jgi:hypothetical protein
MIIANKQLRRSIPNFLLVFVLLLFVVCSGGLGLHHVPCHGLAGPLEVLLLLHDHDLLPGLDGEERLHCRHHGDLQRDPGPVPADVGGAGAPGWVWHAAGLAGRSEG